MEVIVCKNCGAPRMERENGYLYCRYCDSRFILTKEERSAYSAGNIFTSRLSHSSPNVSISMSDDISRLLQKCKTDPKNARKYANLILDIDADNEEALKYL